MPSAQPPKPAKKAPTKPPQSRPPKAPAPKKNANQPQPPPPLADPTTTTSTASKAGQKRPLQDPTTSTAPPSKKTRNTAPPPSAQPSPAPAAPTPTPAPRTLPANAHDYLHDSSGTLAALLDSYEVTTTQIISSSKMHAKIARALDTLLRRFDFADPAARPAVAMVYARAAVGGKLVSVVEVVKREIARKGGCWFQYCALGEGVGVIPRREGGGEEREGNDMEVDDGGEEGAFETMKTRRERVVEGAERRRAVPVMSIYLSRVRIERLRNAYG